MKKCSNCKTKKNLEDFHKASQKPDGVQSVCKICKKDMDAARWEQPGFKEKRKIQMRSRREKLMQRVYEYLLEHPCVECGESDPVVLEFDHLNDKLLEVSEMLRSAWSWDNIYKEIQKCEVRCANCHRRKTANQMDWFILKLRVVD